MIFKKRSILHISPHLGGGVGRVLLNIVTANSENHHTIYSLDSINERAQKHLQEHRIEYHEHIHKDIDRLFEAIEKVDIVIMHWWNHPLLYNLMVRYTLPECRLLLWSHVSGQEAPQCFSSHLLNYPDYFVFTTPMSFLTEEISNDTVNIQKLKSIWSTGGFDHIRNVKHTHHESFNIGYIGTVDFAKMYPNFIALCSQITIANVQFIVCGDGGDIERLKRQAHELHIADKFVFTGHVENIAEYLETFDLFGYPLDKNHYGTCDQALAEAMACGVIPIVFNNNMENYMVHHMYNGIVAKDEKEYVDGIIKLYNNKLLRDKLSENAREEGLRRFSIGKTLRQWDMLFEETLKQPKSIKRWNGNYSGNSTKPHEVFLESIGDYAIIFKKGDEVAIQKLSESSLAWQAKTKGSPFHYNSFFKDDKILIQWKNIFMTQKRKR